MTTNYQVSRPTTTYECPACKKPVDPLNPSFIGYCLSCGDDLAVSATNQSQKMQSLSEDMNRLAWTWYERANVARQAAADYAARLAAEQSVAGKIAPEQAVTAEVPVGTVGTAEKMPSVSVESTPALVREQAWTPEDQAPQARQMRDRTPRGRSGHGLHVEPAVLLQGLGALLLLAALTIITTVSWAFLPAVGQAAVLAIPLVVMGGSAIWLRKRLPTTSTVLALLTIGAGLVQAVALPELLAAFDFAWYPPLAATVGIVIFGLAGHWGKVLVWRVFAVAAVPLVPALAAWSLIAESELDAASSAVVLTVVTAPFVGALLVVAWRIRSEDSTTAMVAWWTSAIMVPILGLAMIGDLGRLVTGGPNDVVPALAWGFGTLLVAVLAYGVGRLATGSDEVWKMVAAGVAAIPIPVILGWGIGAQTLWVVVPVLFFTGALFVIVVSDIAPRIQTAFVSGLVVAQLAVIGTALSNSGQSWAWLLVSGSALGASAVLIGLGVKRQAAVACWAGLFGLLVTWATLWVWDFVGPHEETLIWPMVAMIIATASVAQPRFDSMKSWWPGPGLPLLALAAGTPGVLASWQQHYVNGTVSGLTTFSLLVLVTLIILSALAGWMPAPRTSVAAVFSVLLLPHVWITLSARGGIDAVLLVSVLTAVGVGFVGAFAVQEGLVEPTWVYVATAFTLLIGSTTLTVLDPVNTWQEDRWRMWFVGLGLVAAIAGAARPWPDVARYLGATTLALGLWWYLAISVWAWGGVEGGLPPEVWTGPTLVVLIAIIYVVPTFSERPLLASFVAMGILLVSTALALQTLASVTSPLEIDGFVDAARVVLVPLLWLGWTVAARWSGTRVWRVLGVVSALTLWAYWVVIGVQRDVQAAADGVAGLPIEYYTIATGILIAAIIAVVSWPVDKRQRWDRIGLAPTALVLAMSTALVLVSSVGENAARTILVLAGWVILGTLSAVSGRRTWAAVSGSVAILVLLRASQQVIDVGVLEAITYPAAAAVAAWTWIWVAARNAKLSTMFTMAPSAALVLLPSALVMWLGEPIMWRFWLTLGLGIAGLAVGLRFLLAGLVWPSALALVVLAAPVVVRWTQSAPMWVPLSLGGLALLLVGAKFEATRRAGRQAGEWVSTLH